MLSFKEYCKLNEGQTAPHLLPPAGISRKVLKGKSDFDAHITANAAGSKKQRGSDGRTYHVKNGRVHGVWNSEAGTGVVYTSSKNESEELDESGWIGSISKWKEAVQAKHGHSLPTFKKVAQPGVTGKSTTYARNSTTGDIVGVYQHHNKMGTVHESVELDEAEGLTAKKNQNGGHDVYHNGTHIGHVEQKSMPWLRGKTIKKVFAKKPNGDSVVVDSDATGKNTIESAKKTLLRHHLVESVELDEATFVSDSPSTNASRGVKFDVQKNKEKSTGEHANGQPKEHHDVYHDGKHVGHVASYSGYKDKKAPGARIVSSRKDVRLWHATIHGGEHNRHGTVFNTTPAGSQYYQGGFTSKKDALQHLADAHNSNKNR